MVLVRKRPQTHPLFLKTAQNKQKCCMAQKVHWINSKNAAALQSQQLSDAHS
jgi:hypothetical protein